MLADRLEIAGRLQRETDEIVAAAVALRRAHDEWQFQRIRSLDAAEKERRRRRAAGAGDPTPPGITEERLRTARRASKIVHRGGSPTAADSLPLAAAG